MGKKYKIENEFAFIKNRKRDQKSTTSDIEGKICVISGCTSGVGLETLKKLAQGKADIIMIARNKEKAMRVRAEIIEFFNVSPEIVIADFSSLEDIRKAAKKIQEIRSSIDILINSAGIHATKKILTEEGFELAFCVNHLAPFLLTVLLLDLLKKSSYARIIQVNSEGHRFGGLNISDLSWKKRPYIGLRGYGASKTAQIMTVIKLANLLEKSGITINAVHPGGVKTNIGTNNGWLYRFWLKTVVWNFLKDPVISGESIYYLAASPDLKGATGKYYNLTIEEQPAPHVYKEGLIDKVFEISLELTGCKGLF
jgi:NAD(P)-dependent dehydrogenase (short-subunit alcohol dehydrogenase family)